MIIIKRKVSKVGWEKKENTGENSEVSTQSIPTQTNPTFSREDLGAALTDY